MLNLLKINKNFLKNQHLNFYENKKINKIKKSIEKENLVTITWLYTINKTAYINETINRFFTKNKIFYFNKNLDFFNKIKNKKNLVELIKEFSIENNTPQIIILEECDKVEDIKIFIKDFYKKWYKIIIIWNNIEVSSKPEIEIFPLKFKNYKKYFKEKISLDNLLVFGDNEEQIRLTDKKIKLNILENQKNSILLKDIYEKFSIKNTTWFENLIIFLSILNKSISIREIYSQIKKENKISLVTINDYLDYATKSKLIKKIFPYDFKKQKEINSKAKYYFTNLWIRNSLNYFSTSKNEAIKNLIFLELLKNSYKINSWINWKFSFSFFAKKLKEEKDEIKSKILYIHLSEAKDKKELKKEINKLNKVPYFPTISKEKNISEKIEKFLIVENIENLKIKKLKYDQTEIIELKNFLKKI